MLAPRHTWPSASARATPSWRRSAASNATSHVRCLRSSSSARGRSIRRESLLDKQKGVRGSQYAAGDYRKILQAAAITQSMSRKANCWDNAPMERFFGTLKTELVHQREYPDREAARRDLFGYIEGYYNRRRIHSAIGYITPEQADRKSA